MPRYNLTHVEILLWLSRQPCSTAGGYSQARTPFIQNQIPNEKEYITQWILSYCKEKRIHWSQSNTTAEGGNPIFCQSMWHDGQRLFVGQSIQLQAKGQAHKGRNTVVAEP